jgi:S1-C subfamily serine protease
MRKRFFRMPRGGSLAAVLAAALLAAGSAVIFAQPGAEKTAARSGEAGVLVVTVVPGSPAEKSGISRGDIVLSVDGKDVNAATELAAAVEKRKPGESLSVKLSHGDTVKTVSLTLAEENGRPYAGIIPLPSGPGRAGWGWMRGPWMHGQPARERGALLARVVPGSPADKAGLKAGEVIQSVDGEKVEPDKDLAELIGSHKAGDSVTLSVAARDSAPRDVKVTLEENPASKGGPYLGIEYAPTGGYGRAEGELPGLTAGVLVRQVAEGGPAAKAGVRPRDIIVAVEHVPVTSPHAVAQAVAARKPGDTIALTVSRFAEEKETSISVTLGEDPKKSGQAYLGISMGRYFGWEGPEGMPGFGAMMGPRGALPPGMPWFGYGDQDFDQGAPGI